MTAQYVERILAAARANPQRTPIGDVQGNRLSAAALIDQVAYVQRVLRSLRLYGKKVAMILPDGPDCATAFLGVSPVATLAPLSAQNTDSELCRLISGLKPAAVLAPATLGWNPEPGIMHLELRNRKNAAPGQFDIAGFPRLASETVEPAIPRDADAIALILHTSGTTGTSRRVALSHRALSHAAAKFEQIYSLTPSDRVLTVSPMTHTLGLFAGMLAPLYSGATVVIGPGMNRDLFPDWWNRVRPTVFSAVPFVYQTIVDVVDRTGVELVQPRLIRSAAAPLPERVRREVERVFRSPLHQMYAMTEAIGILGHHPADGTPRQGSCGKAFSGEVRILGSDGHFLAPGERGEIVTRGPHLFSGYEDDPEATKAAFHDGWLRSGDEGYMDADGYVYVTGRLKDTIIRGGENIMPLEVDRALCEHPSVQEALTVGIASEALGEEVAAAVVLRPGMEVTVAELQAHSVSRLAPFKVPRYILFTDRIPRNGSGKPDRVAGRDLVAKAQANRQREIAARPKRAGAQKRSQTEVRISEIWAEVFGNGLDPEATFSECGGDSLMAAALLSRISDEFGIGPLDLGTLWEAPTIERLAEHLDRTHGAKASRVDCFEIDVSAPGEPLIWIAPEFLQRHVWQELRGWRPFYGLTQPGYLWDSGETSIEQVAVECRKAVMARIPRQPVTIAGWCFGGVVAFELARQLRQVWDEPVEVAIFDGHDLLAGPGGIRSHIRRAQRWTGRAVFHLRKTGSSNWRRWIPGLTTVAGTLAGFTPARKAIGSQVYLVQKHLLRSYRPLPLVGRVVHFIAADHPKGRAYDPARIWGPHVYGEHLWTEVPGAHLSMFQPPNAAALASKMREFLPVQMPVAVPQPAPDPREKTLTTTV